MTNWGARNSLSRDLCTGADISGAEPENLRRVKLLLEAGARWDPSPDELRSHRHAILGHRADYIADLLRLLLSVPDAINKESFRELCRSSTLSSKLAAAHFDLAAALVNE